jgi:hypothetical protein
MARTTKGTTKNVLKMRKSAPRSVNPSAGDIASRAFELYCKRGYQDGHDVQDWLQAERELQESARSTAA